MTSLLFIFIIMLFSKRSTVFVMYAVLKRENEILKRRLDNLSKKVQFTGSDRLFFHFIAKLFPKAKKVFTLVSPHTVLYKWKEYCKLIWTYPAKIMAGRPSISSRIRKLIIEMKKLNPLWGNLRISGELEKLDLQASKDTVRRVIQKGRKDGDILPVGSWKTFILAHIKSLFCCDFFCIDTVFSKRIYIFFIEEIKSRKIVQYGVTTNPCMRFVRNQLASFMFNRQDKTTHLIHDNSGELKWFDYESLGITDVKIPAYSPNLNAYAERFVRSAKTECFDYFIILSLSHARNIMHEYVNYYNNQRPHQGIGNKCPAGAVPSKTGRIKTESVLFGLYTNFYRAA